MHEKFNGDYDIENLVYIGPLPSGFRSGESWRTRWTQAHTSPSKAIAHHSAILANARKVSGRYGAISAR
jgi:hypothetical protein